MFIGKAVPKEAALKAYITDGILISLGTRCCAKHLDGNAFKKNTDFSTASLIEESDLSGIELANLLNDLRKKANVKNGINFDSSRNDEEYHNLTGLSCEQFDVLLSYVSAKNSVNRTPRTALGIFLMRLRTGLSHQVLATLFGFRSRTAISKLIASIRNDLASTFVPNHLGFGHITRAEVIRNHTTKLSSTLFADGNENCAILVLDGTYIYIEKSSDYSFSKRSYSVHKGRPLVKPMMIVTTSGYIVSVLGPYLADGKNNDASIIKHIVGSNSEDIVDWMEDSDVLIVDRGFQDALDVLNECGYKTFMPPFLSKKQQQFTTHEANESRLVTKVRWVVEAVNGRIKQWKFINNIIRNTELRFIGQYVNIVCALCNAFRPDLAISKEIDETVAHSMLARKDKQNKLQSQIELGQFKPGKKWTVITETEVSDFPKLSESDLRELTFGVYQIKQAKSYTDEHLKDGQYTISVQQNCPEIVYGLIQSRHVSKKKYHVWIKYHESGIVSWYCKCKAGARVIGCCAHIASILWYLGLARHQDYKVQTAKTSYFLDAAAPCLDTSHTRYVHRISVTMVEMT